MKKLFKVSFEIYEPVLAESGEEAIKIFRQQWGNMRTYYSTPEAYTMEAEAYTMEAEEVGTVARLQQLDCTHVIPYALDEKEGRTCQEILLEAMKEA